MKAKTVRLCGCYAIVGSGCLVLVLLVFYPTPLIRLIGGISALTGFLTGALLVLVCDKQNSAQKPAQG